MQTRSSFLESMGPLAALADGDGGPFDKPWPIDAVEIADLLCWFTELKDFVIFQFANC